MISVMFPGQICSVDYYLDLAQTAQDKHHMPKERRILRFALGHYPDNVDLWYKLGLSHKRKMKMACMAT